MKNLASLCLFLAFTQFSIAKCTYWYGIKNLTKGTGITYDVIGPHLIGPYYFTAGDSIQLWMSTYAMYCPMSHAMTTWTHDSVPITPYITNSSTSACLVFTGGYYQLATYVMTHIYYAFILVDSPNAVTETESNILFNIFPNPVSQQLNLEFVKEANYTITLQNSSGESVFQTSNNSIDLEFDVAHLPKGIYFLRVKEGNKNSASRKIVKM